MTKFYIETDFRGRDKNYLYVDEHKFNIITNKEGEKGIIVKDHFFPLFAEDSCYIVRKEQKENIKDEVGMRNINNFSYEGCNCNDKSIPDMKVKKDYYVEVPEAIVNSLGEPNGEWDLDWL
jgi:hypothetical protein